MSKLRDFARDQTCTLRIPNVCNGDPATVVLAHGRGAGMGTKVCDYIGAHACSDCHAYIDSSPADYHEHFAPALLETLIRVFKSGLMTRKVLNP